MCTELEGVPGLAIARRGSIDFIPRTRVLLRRFYSRLTELWLRHAAIKELQRLSRRDLSDIGIEPYEIETVIDDMLAKGRLDE